MAEELRECIEILSPKVIDWKESECLSHEMSLRIIQTTLIYVLDHLDDVTCVSFDTWLVTLDYQAIIEFYR